MAPRGAITHYHSKEITRPKRIGRGSTEALDELHSLVTKASALGMRAAFKSKEPVPTALLRAAHACAHSRGCIHARLQRRLLQDIRSWGTGSIALV